MKKIEFDDLTVLLQSCDRILGKIVEYCSEQRNLNDLKIKKVPYDYTNLDDRGDCLFNIEAYWTLFLCKTNQLRECLDCSTKPCNFDEIIYKNPFILWNYFFINQRHWDIHDLNDLKIEKKSIYKAINDEYNKELASTIKNNKLSPPFINIRAELFERLFKKYYDKIEKNDLKQLQKRILNKNKFSLNLEQAKKLNDLIKNNKIEFSPPILTPNVDMVQINQLSTNKALDIHNFIQSLLWEIWSESSNNCKEKLYSKEEFINSLWSSWREHKLVKNLKN